MKTCNGNLTFLDHPIPIGRTLQSDRPWFVLVVGRDSPAQRKLQSELTGFRPLGRAIKVLAAKTPAETLKTLVDEMDIAVVLIGGGLEGRGQTCLDLGKEIREMGLVETRILLHSATLGEEINDAVAETYDINDFRGKENMSRRTVEMMVVSAIRAYHRIHAINRSHQMLRRIAQTSAAMIAQGSIAGCAMVATHAAVKLLSGNSGFLSFMDRGGRSFSDQEYYGVGTYATGVIPPSKNALTLIERAFERESHVFGESGTVFYVRLHSGPKAAAIYVDGAAPRDEATYRLIDILSAQIASGINKMWFVHRIDYMALHDESTGLPNRCAMEHEIDCCIARGERHCIVSILNLETHTEVEASLGEDAASRMVKAIADRVEATGAKVGRLGPCQLVVLGKAQRDAHASVPRELTEHILVDGLHLPVHLTIGTCELDAANSGSTAIRQARAALRHARKHNRGGVRAYDETMTRSATNRLSMISDMKQAIDTTGQFQVYYQPQYDMTTGALIGAEALLRWRRNGVPVSPADFIPVAEATGLIRQIGLVPIFEGINQAASWYRQGTPIVVGINLSPAQLGDSVVIDLIERTLAETAVPAELIEFELTETAATTLEDASSIINLLRGMGLRIAIDDFGTGYSSLQRLANLNFDRIKIDREFVSKASSSLPHRVVCQMAVNLAKSLSISVLAEGVETEVQAQLLVEMGCREAQGFLYGVPVPAHSFVLTKPKTWRVA